MHPLILVSKQESSKIYTVKFDEELLQNHVLENESAIIVCKNGLLTCKR